MTSLVRREHLALANGRALEEEAERYNPVNPKQMLSNRKENTRRLSGQGATPSMGVSEFRGGANHEAHMMGQHLGHHLMSLHGGAFHKAFLHGMGVYEDEEGPADYVKPETKFDESGHRAPSSSVNEVRRAKANENYKAKSSAGEKLAQGALGVLSKAGKAAAQNLHKAIPGSERVGQTISDLIPTVGSGYSETQRAKMMLGQKNAGRNRSKGPPLLSGGDMLNQPLPVSGTNLSLSGSSMTGAYEGQGRMVGAGDGRRKRAEIVKKVMKEKGMKMIEASKYVKQHNLY